MTFQQAHKYGRLVSIDLPEELSERLQYMADSPVDFYPCTKCNDNSIEIVSDGDSGSDYIGLSNSQIIAEHPAGHIHYGWYDSASLCISLDILELLTDDEFRDLMELPERQQEFAIIDEGHYNELLHNAESEAVADAIEQWADFGDILLHPDMRDYLAECLDELTMENGEAYCDPVWIDDILADN